jgi:tetratricopeptide (TPR) repeat protein
VVKDLHLAGAIFCPYGDETCAGKVVPGFRKRAELVDEVKEIARQWGVVRPTPSESSTTSIRAERAVPSVRQSPPAKEIPETSANGAKAAIVKRIEELSKSILGRAQAADLLVERGRLCGDLGKYDEAARDFVTALTCPGSNAQLRIVYEGAVRDGQVFSRVADLLPHDERLRIERGHFLAYRGQWGPAVRELKPVIEPYRINGVTLHYARLLLLTGNHEEYRNLCQQLSAKYGETIDANMAADMTLICTADSQSGVDSETALGWAERTGATSRDAGNFAALVAANYRAGRHERALAYADESKTRFGWDYGGTAFLRAMALYRLGQHEKSRKAYDAGLVMLRDQGPRVPGEPARVALGDWLFLNVMHREAKVVLGLTEGPPPQTQNTAP